MWAGTLGIFLCLFGYINNGDNYNEIYRIELFGFVGVFVEVMDLWDGGEKYWLESLVRLIFDNKLGV